MTSTGHPPLGNPPPAPENSYDRDRTLDVSTRPLSPNSLVGSYFRAPDDTQGIVVCEAHSTPATVIYLVEFYGERGFTGHQELFDLETMLAQKWSFYDSEAWLTGPPATRTQERG